MSLKYTVQWTAEGVDLSELILWKLEFVELQFHFILFNMQTVKLVKKEISSMIYQVWSPVQSLYNISYEWVIEYECNLHNIATLKNVNVHRGWCIKFATGLNGRFTTIASHFVANYIDIFHKTVV